MSANLDSVHAISRAVLLEEGRGLDVAAVSAADGGTDRVEVLVTADSGEGGCRFVVNVTRADSARFEQEFRTKLHQALVRHHVADS